MGSVSQPLTGTAVQPSPSRTDSTFECGEQVLLHGEFREVTDVMEMTNGTTIVGIRAKDGGGTEYVNGHDVQKIKAFIEAAPQSVQTSARWWK